MTVKLVLDAKTAKGAAGQLSRYLKRRYDADLFVRSERVRYSDGKVRTVHEVSWEEGPFEWAVIAMGGGGLYDEENGLGLYATGTEIEFFAAKGWTAECANSYTARFYPFVEPISLYGGFAVA
jgi:hypothetical protein